MDENNDIKKTDSEENVLTDQKNIEVKDNENTEHEDIRQEFSERVNISREIMQTTFDDYDEMECIYSEQHGGQFDGCLTDNEWLE